MVRVVRDPEPEVALHFLRDELAGLGTRGHLIQIIGTCAVRYAGRARSMLSEGDRLIMLKPDGTLLVHTASKAKPVNWQPPGASFDAALDDGVVLTAVRAAPEEMVRIRFQSIALLMSIPLRDEARLDLLGSEDDLQALLFATPDLVEPGFVPQRRERESRQGYWDLDGRDAEGRRLIVEVKRTTAGVKDATQLRRYVEGLPGARGILVAPKIAPKARQLLDDHGLDHRVLRMADLLPHIERMRRAGQSSLDGWSR